MKRIASCLIFLNLMLFSITIFANFDEVAFDRDTKMINVSGNAGESMGKQLVSVVIKCDGNVEDIKVIRAEDNSDFKCSFAVADKTAEYEISYQTPDSEEGVKAYSKAYSSEVVRGAIKAFSMADTKEKMHLIFSENSDYVEVLGLSDELIGEISNDDTFYTSLSLKAGKVKKVKDIVDLVNETAIVQIFTEASTQQISELIEKYNVLIGISSLELYKNYTAFAESEKTGFEEKFKEYTFTSLNDMIEAFEACTVLTEIQYSAYYTDTQRMIEKYYEKLSISMDDYNALSERQKKDVMKALTGDNFSDTENFETSWINTIKSVSNVNTVGGGNSGGGGSYGGGGSIGGGGVVQIESPGDVPIKTVSFIDMNDALWAKEAILSLANDGVVNGKSEYHFCPNENVTRAEFVKILIGALGFEIEPGDCKFDDVKADDWSYPYICTAVGNKIVFGYSEREFGAENNITRQDMIVMLMRALKMKNNINVHNELELTFDDIDEIDEYALRDIKDAVYYEMVRGMGDNCIKPKEFATRAQAAMLIYQSTKTDFNN